MKLRAAVSLRLPVPLVKLKKWLPDTFAFQNLTFAVQVKDKITMKPNQTTLNKLEKILDEAEYIVRYERGTFQSGYCILEAKKVVVLNKFLGVEGRVNTLIDLMPQIKLNFDLLTHESQKLYEEILKKSEPEATNKQNELPFEE